CLYNTSQHTFPFSPRALQKGTGLLLCFFTGILMVLISLATGNTVFLTVAIPDEGASKSKSLSPSRSSISPRYNSILMIRCLFIFSDLSALLWF
ncbi:MAG: hypothetical protein CSA35_03735, partial [Dethiosulfovibrio peptidovorans]